MMLRIDKDRLHDLLKSHKRDLEMGKAECAINVVAAVFYLPAAYSIENIYLRYGLLVLAIVFLIWNGYVLIRVIKNHYGIEELFKDIENMDIHSSIVAVRDATGEFRNRYLVYWDDGWGCDFFPNHRMPDADDSDQTIVAEYLKNQFEIPDSDFQLRHIVNSHSSKPSSEHNNETRHYDYHLYEADVKKMPPNWKGDAFTVGSKQCKWMTLDEMERDTNTKTKNSDVINLVRQYAS